MCRERQQVWAAGSLDVNHQLGLSHEQRCAYGVMRCMLRQKRVLERRSRADKDEYEKGSHGERNLRKHAEQTAPLSECSRKPQFSSVQFSSVQFSSVASLAVLTTSGASDREGTALRNWHGWTSGAGMVWLFPVPRVERARARPASDEFWRYGVLARQGPSRRRGRLAQRRQGRSRAFTECAPHPGTLPAPPHALSHACVCARHTGACNMSWVQQRRCWRRTLRESSRERGGSATARTAAAARPDECPKNHKQRQMAEQGARRGSARHEGPVLPSRDVNRELNCARAC